MGGVTQVGVIDIGKTNVKVAVVDVVRREETGVMTRPNTVLPGPPYPHYDIDGHWDFILSSLRALHRERAIEAISITAHGASAVLLDTDGNLAAPVLDYEFDGPDSLAAEYDAIRPDFSETGSPRLPGGLNVGAQIFWQLTSDPGLGARLSAVVTYPQYWAYRLTGVMACEVTSLGCHTDLWCPLENRYSSLVDRLGLADRMAPIRRAAEQLGTLRPQVARTTGLPPEVPVSCGIHDSNASLYPHLLMRDRPFSVVSTGTWVIVLSIGGHPVHLDPARDTLINVDAFGDPVPSARFMGGREFDTVMEGHARDHTDVDADQVLKRKIMLFPSVEPRSGPYQGNQYRWSVDETVLTDGERHVGLSFYLALMTAQCLTMTGADGPTIVEGPFSKNRRYLDMLQAATGRAVDAAGGSVTGTSIGAALLATGAETGAENRPQHMEPDFEIDPRLVDYAATWRAAVGHDRAVQENTKSTP